MNYYIKILFNPNIITGGATSTYINYSADKIVTEEVEKYIYSIFDKSVVLKYDIIDSKFSQLKPGDFVKVVYTDLTGKESHKIDIVKSCSANYIVCENGLDHKFHLDGTPSNKRSRIRLEMPSDEEIQEMKQKIKIDEMINDIEYNFDELYNISFDELTTIYNILHRSN